MSNDEAAKYHLLLEEYRTKLHRVDATCKELRNRMLLFLTADIAILTYFFSGIESLLPSELYGIIFFGIGIFCVLASICTLLTHFCARKNWPSPIGPVEIEKIQKSESEKEVLQVVIDDYRTSYLYACKVTDKYAKAANLALLLFGIGVIILLIIKFF